MKLKLRPEVRLVWSAPEGRIAPFCSVVGCGEHIPADAVPLMMWSASGACVQFCDKCAERCFVVEGER